MSRDIRALAECLQPVALDFFDKCSEIGLPIFFTHTHRTDEEQQTLYDQGRTKPGRIVTNAKSGQSPHNPPGGFPGLAFDVAFKKPGDPYEEPRPGAWEEIGDIAESLNLVWGGRWKSPDRPHFEWPNWEEVASRLDPQKSPSGEATG